MVGGLLGQGDLDAPSDLPSQTLHTRGILGLSYQRRWQYLGFDGRNSIQGKVASVGASYKRFLSRDYTHPEDLSPKRSRRRPLFQPHFGVFFCDLHPLLPRPCSLPHSVFSPYHIACSAPPTPSSFPGSVLCQRRRRGRRGAGHLHASFAQNHTCHLTIYYHHCCIAVVAFHLPGSCCCRRTTHHPSGPKHTVRSVHSISSLARETVRRPVWICEKQQPPPVGFQFVVSFLCLMVLNPFG